MKKLSMLETIQVHGIWSDVRSQTSALSNTGYRLHRAMMQVNISDKDTLTLTCSAQLTSARSQGVGMLAFQHRFSPALVGHATV